MSLRTFTACIAGLALAAIAFQQTLLEAMDWSQIETLREVLKRGYQFFKLDLAMIPELGIPILQTVSIALAGSLLATLIVIGLTRLGNSGPNLISAMARRHTGAMLALSGAIHELIWGLLLVAVLGPGFAVGVVALAIRSMQPIAQRLSPAPESGRSSPPGHEAARVDATGNARIIRATVCAWADNLGRAAVLGLVGVGGLGLQFYERLTSYQFGATASTLIAILALIFIGRALIHRLDGQSLRQWHGNNAATLSGRLTRLAASPTHGLSWWSGGSGLALLVGIALIPALIWPHMAASGNTIAAAVDFPTDFGAFFPGLMSAAAETLQMNFLATVLGVAMALVLTRLAALPTPWLGRPVRLFALSTVFVSLGLPAIFVALLGRSILTIGPASGMLALALAATGIASRMLLLRSSRAAEVRGNAAHHLSADSARIAIDTFVCLLPVATVIGVFGSGGTGWILRLSVISGQTSHIVASLVCVATLISASHIGCTWLRSVMRLERRRILRKLQSTNSVF